MSCNHTKKDLNNSNDASTQESEKQNTFYSFLKIETKKGIMLGHQNTLAFGNMWYGEKGRSDVKSVCGDYPAVFGWDIGKIETGLLFNIDSIPFDKIKEFIIEADEMGGISTVCWTADNPVLKQDSINDTIITDLPKNMNYKKYLLYLDYVANFFLSLKNKQGKYIPIVFRPFHDNNLKNNWWSNDKYTPDEFKKLWVFTFNYLQHTKKVTNIIWAYSLFNPVTEEAFFNYYPGNNYVDVLGVDIFLQLKDDPKGIQYKTDLDRCLSTITQLAKSNNKIPALTSTGLEGIKISNYFSDIVFPIISKYEISYVLFWSNSWKNEENYFIPIPGHPASDDFVNFVSNPNILTCSKMR